MCEWCMSVYQCVCISVWTVWAVLGRTFAIVCSTLANSFSPAPLWSTGANGPAAKDCAIVENASLRYSSEAGDR